MSTLDSIRALLSPDPLRARSLADRRQAVEAVKMKAAANTAKKRAEAEAAAVQEIVDVEEAGMAIVEHATVLQGELARDMHAELCPLAERFADAPRDTARKMKAAWRAFDARAVDEFGALEGVDPKTVSPLTSRIIELDPMHIVFAFLAAKGDDVLALAGSPQFRERFRQTKNPAAVFLSDEGDAACEDALRDLEIAVDRLVAVAPFMTPNAARLEVMMRYATVRSMRAALEAFDREAETTRQADAMAAWEREHGDRVREQQRMNADARIPRTLVR